MSTESSIVNAAHGTSPLMGENHATKENELYSGNKWNNSSEPTLVSPEEYEDVWSECDSKPLPRQYVTPRRWVVCFTVTGVLVLLLVILLPIVFLLIIPKTVQGELDNAKLDFSSATITQPTNNSFHLDAVMAVSNAGSTNAILTYVAPVVVLYNSNQIFNLTLQPISISGGTGQVPINQTVYVYNSSAWAEVNKDLLAQSSLNLEFESTISVSALGQTFNNVHLDKTVSVQGLGGLNNVSLDNFEIQAPVFPGGFIPIKALLNINNPSNFNVQVGNITFSLYLTNGTKIGNFTAESVDLKQGDNSASAVGFVTGDPPINSLQALFNNFVNGNGINGIATDVPGAPQWLLDAIVGLKMELNAPGNDLIQDIQFGNNGLVMAFTSDAPYAPHFNVSGIKVILDPHFQFNVNFTAIDQFLTILYQGIAMAVISATNSPASGSGIGGSLTTTLSSTLQVLSGQELLFQSFLNAIFNGASSSSVNLGINGTANVYANTAAGTVSIDGVPMSASWGLNGIGGLNGVSVSSAPVITSANNTGLKLNLPLNMNNTSTVTFSPGAISMYLLTGGQIIGSMTIPDGTTFIPGFNAITAKAVYNPQGSVAQTAGQAFLSSFISNSPVTVTAQGYNGSSDVASLNGVFSGLSFTQSLPAGGEEFLSSEKINVESIFPPALSITLYANNFYPIPITMTHLTSTISDSSGSTTLATINQDTNWIIPANVRSSSSPRFSLTPTTDGIFAYITSGGTPSAIANSTITANLGGYGPVTFTIAQSL